MQILIISSKFPFPLKDGGAIATYNLISGLSRLNNNIFLLSLNTKKHFIEAEKITDKLFNNIEYLKVNIDTTPGILEASKNLVFSDLPYILKRFKSLEFEKGLLKVLNTYQFDIVQIEGLYMLQYLNLIKLHSKAKIAYRPHNVEFQIWEKLSQSSDGILKKIYYKILANRILKYETSIINKYDFILPISDEDADFFKHLGNSKPLEVTPTGFEISSLPNFEHTLTNPSIFFIGSMEWRPNQEAILWFLTYCWDILHHKYPNLKWYIAGRNAPLKLKNKFNSPNIVWMGEIESALNFIADKSIMIVPLQSGSGMRIKIIEAFLNAKPVVSTNIGARGTKAKNNENILLADSPVEFIDQINKLIEQPQLYRTIAKNSFNFAKDNFDIQKISNALMSFYKQQTTKKTIC